MAYTDFVDDYAAAPAGSGLLARIAHWVRPRPVTGEMAPGLAKRLAGPDPLDARTRGYLADLDTEVGF